MINLTDYGFSPAMMPVQASGIPARITAVHRERFDLICEHGECSGKLKASVYYGGTMEFPTTGDFVLIDYNEGGDSIILQTLKRRSFFSRLDPSSAGHASQAVAANFDYVFIMQSLNHDFNIPRLERYLAAAWQSGAVPAVILTKADLVPDYEAYLREAEKIAAGACVYAVSTKSRLGIDALSKHLKPGKTAVFLGSSGVGKSSLVNTLAGEEIMNVNGIREDDSKGRHTTTHRQLIMLKSGVLIIDTPGMRALGMWDADEGLDQAFADVEQYFGKCRFRDCRHISEPGCAITDAISRGELSAERWERYRSLKSEIKYSDNKEEYLRRKEEWHKNISIINKQKTRKRGDYNDD